MPNDAPQGLADYDTPAKLRAFLLLALDPGRGPAFTRTPERLAAVLPEPLAERLGHYAPHLGELRRRADVLEEQARQARQDYADELAGWIRGNEPRVRRSLPLLDAVAVAYEAAVAHIDHCGTCHSDMRLAEMCPAGQREAIAGLDAVPAAATDCAHQDTDDVRTVAGQVLARRCSDCRERLAAAEPACAHIAWEVTSEYRNNAHMWVKSRRCADCREDLEPSIEREPHWPDEDRANCTDCREHMAPVTEPGPHRPEKAAAL